MFNIENIFVISSDDWLIIRQQKDSLNLFSDDMRLIISNASPVDRTPDCHAVDKDTTAPTDDFSSYMRNNALLIIALLRLAR